MKRFATLLLAASFAIAPLSKHGAQAAPLGIPASVYPAGAHIRYDPTLTNAQMDCMWGFFCEGNLPLFHRETQDQLHRAAGWGQFAGVQRKGRPSMGFDLFVSQYDPVAAESGVPWSKQAFLDLKVAIHAQGYRRNSNAAHLLPAPRAGGALVAVQRSGQQDLVVMAAWSGTQEVEGLASYDHRSSTAKQTAWASLARQVRLTSGAGAYADRRNAPKSRLPDNPALSR